MKDLLTIKKNSPMQQASKLVELASKAKTLRDELAKITEEMAGYKENLLKVTQELDVLTLKTGAYTISRAIRTTPQVEDFETLKKSLTKAKIPFYTQEVFTEQMDAVFKEALKENMELEGLGRKETQYISVRVNKKDESITEGGKK